MRVQDEDGIKNAQGNLLEALRARVRRRPNAIDKFRLGDVLHDRGLYEEALPIQKEVLLCREKELGAEHPDTLKSVNNMALLLQSMGKLKEAEPLCKRAWEAKEKTLGPDHPSTLISVTNMASLLQDMGKLDEAEPLYKRDLEASERALGPDHPSTLISVNNMAVFLQDMASWQRQSPCAKGPWKRTSGLLVLNIRTPCSR